jgi:hypothetical protein
MLFGGENLRERDYLKDVGIDGRILLKWFLKKYNVRAWTGFIWLRTGTGGGIL